LSKTSGSRVRIAWQANELELLRQHYPTTPWSDLLVIFPSRTPRKLRDKANRMGLVRYRPPARTADEVRAAKREHMARRRAQDPDAARAYQRHRHQMNRERIRLQLRAYFGRRFFWARASRLRGHGRATAADLARLWRRQRGLCALTGRRLDRSAQIDHILPKARGGGDQATNLRWVCSQVNIAKRHMTDDEFFGLCADVMAWIGRRIALVEEVAP
jgi:5-methylcytosine-specific restriction endonuclease McrA